MKHENKEKESETRKSETEQAPCGQVDAKVRFKAFNILSEFHLQEIPGNILDFYGEVVIYCLLKHRKIVIDRACSVREEITPYEILNAIIPKQGKGAIKTVDLIQNISDSV